MNLNHKPREGATAPELKGRWVGIGIFLAVLVFYIAKAPAFAVPGRWAGIMAAFSGLDPFRPLIRPIWSLLTFLLTGIPFFDPAHTINLLSAALGAGACWLLYSITSQIPYVRSFRRKGQSAVERVPRMVAGIIAALFAAVSLPMIMVSTRGDYAALDAFLVLLPFLPAVWYWKAPQLKHLYLSFLLFGLALIEYPTSVFALPLFLGAWIYLLWKTKWPSLMTIAMCLAMMSAGLLIMMLIAGLYSGSASAAIRGLSSADVVKEFFRLYFAELIQGVPKVGWLLVFGTNIIPFAVVMLRELEEPTDKFSAIGVYAFRLVIFSLAVITLFSLPGSSAFVLGPRVMLLAPILLVAIWFGYLVGYYFGLLQQKGKIFAAYTFTGLWVVMLFIAAYSHGRQTSVSHLAAVPRFADELVRELGDRKFLVTDGSLDASILLAAEKARTRINLININAGQSPEHGRYYARMFIDPELSGLAMLGSRALIRGWLNREPSAAGQIAWLIYSEVLSTPGFNAEPAGYFYVLKSEDQATPPASLFQAFESLWPELPLPDLRRMQYGNTGWFQSLFVVRWFSRQANDLGVILEDHQLIDLAVESYRKAMEIWPDNISAAINLFEQARRVGDDQVDAIPAVIRKIVERNPQAMNIHYMVQVCGLVRNPGAFIEEAALLGSKGRGDAALERLMRAAELAEDDTTSAQLSLAALYHKKKMVEDSETIYRSLLSARPDNVQAMYGLFSIALQRRDEALALDMLQQMRANGANARLVDLEQAGLDVTFGRLAEARRRVQAMIRDGDAGNEEWLLLAQIAIQEKDEDGLASALQTLERQRNYVPGLMLLGERAMLQQRYEDAQRYYGRILNLDPASEAALIRMIQIDYFNRDAASLRKHTGALLAIDPEHAYANFMSAYVHIAENNYPLAEAVLRRSLNQVDHASARNELAWVLSRSGKNEEALTHALRAVEMNASVGTYWDTLAGIQNLLRQHQESMESIEKALTLTRRSHPPYMIHAGKIYLDAGEEAKALEILAFIDDLGEKLSEEQKRQVLTLKSRLGESTKP